MDLYSIFEIISTLTKGMHKLHVYMCTTACVRMNLLIYYLLPPLLLTKLTTVYSSLHHKLSKYLDT